MEISARVFGISVMSSIIAFAIIHLGVGIGFIVSYRQYGDLFRPQIGLSAYNLAISFFGFVTGIFGMFCILKNSERFAKIVVITSAALVLFALASLIAALVINSKSSSYVSSHFANNMILYNTDPGARNTIDLLQIDRQCCGENLWIDWARANLNASTPSTNTSLTTMPATNVTSMTTSIAGGTNPMSSTNSPGITGTLGGRAMVTASNVTDSSIQRNRRQSFMLSDSSRHKRQANTEYGGITNLPLSFTVVLPESCCVSEASTTETDSDIFCLSNENRVPNHFFKMGCSKSLDETAGNQSMGIGIINCFMVMLALISIPILIRLPS